MLMIFYQSSLGGWIIIFLINLGNFCNTFLTISERVIFEIVKKLESLLKNYKLTFSNYFSKV